MGTYRRAVALGQPDRKRANEVIFHPYCARSCRGRARRDLDVRARRPRLIEIGLYRLGNHPDKAEDPPEYGMRLDELFDFNPGEHDVVTFDFEADGAEMFLDFDGDSIHI